MPLPASRGEPIRNYVTAAWFNKVTQETNKNDPSGEGYNFNVDHINVEFMLDEPDGTSVSIGEPLVFSDTSLSPENSTDDLVKNTNIIVKCKKPSTSIQVDDYNWGVTTSNATSGFSCGTIVSNGIVWAKFSRSDSTHNFVTIDVSTGTLKSTAAKTRAKIISFTVFSGTSGEGLLLLGQDLDSNYVIVKNTLGRDLGQYAAVSLMHFSPLGPAAQSVGERNPILGILNPTFTSLSNYTTDPIIGILQQPIANNGYGIVQINGFTPASFRYNETSSTATTDYADISSIDDKLTFTQTGPVRVLSRGYTVNSTTGAKYWYVQLGSSTNVGSIDWKSNDFTWSGLGGGSSGATGYGDIWTGGASSKKGDGTKIGLFQIGTTSKLKLGRIGRYRATIDWYVTSVGSLSSTDSLALKVSWASSDIVPGGAYIETFFAHSSVIGGGIGGTLFGQKTFDWNIINSNEFFIPWPEITGAKVPASGSPTSVSVQGYVRIKVIKLGVGFNDNSWSETKKTDAWARGASGGPI